MLVALYIVFLATNLLYAIAKRESKIIIFLTTAFLFVLFCGNTLNGDYVGYESYYDSGDMAVFDLGYRIIAYACRAVGLSYNGFVSVMIVPAYIAVLVYAKKMKANLSVFYSLYFAFLVFYDINQVRNFIASVFLFVALYNLMKGKKIIFLLLVAVGGLFHSIAWIYLGLLFIDEIYMLKTKIYFFLCLCVLLITVVLKFYGDSIPIIGAVINRFSNNPEAGSFYSSTVMGMGFLIPYGYFFMNILLVIYSDNIIRKFGEYDKYLPLLSICYKTIIFSIIFLPLTILNLTFDRIFRNFNLLMYVLAGATIMTFPSEKAEMVTKSQLKYIGFLIIYSLIWAIGTILRYNGFEQVEMDLILHNNMFFN